MNLFLRNTAGTCRGMGEPGATTECAGGMNLSLLEIRNVAKSFGAIRAVNGFSLTIEAGEGLGLMGDNGAGKSTMVKLIAGNFPPTEGEILVEGKDCYFHKPVHRSAL